MATQEVVTLSQSAVTAIIRKNYWLQQHLKRTANKSSFFVLMQRSKDFARVKTKTYQLCKKYTLGKTNYLDMYPVYTSM